MATTRAYSSALSAFPWRLESDGREVFPFIESYILTQQVTISIESSMSDDA